MSVMPLRALAVAIVVVAIVDPAISSRRPSRPIVAVVASSVPDESLSGRVAESLVRGFTVVRGPFAGAAASVVAGDRLPDIADMPAAPLFAVAPRPARAGVTILSVEAPASAPRDSRVPVAVTVRVTGAARQALSVQLATGAGIIDQVTDSVVGDSADVRVHLFHLPTDTGTVLLRASATVAGLTDEATTATHVHDARLQVLFFDPRPSWLSTFVRRSVEDDPRFLVTWRVQASRGVAATGGPAPTSLRDALSIAPFASVVIGAPEALDEAGVAGLEAYARNRGGRIVLLMDQRVAGPVDRLTGMREWRGTRLDSAMVLRTATGDSLRARDFARPVTTPPGTAVHAAFAGRDAIEQPVVFSFALGGGRVYTSGALDAWHFRDGNSGFDRFWTNQLAEWSAGAPAPLEVVLDRRVAAPGQSIAVTVAVRAAAAVGDRTVPVAVIAGDDSAVIRPWPVSTRGLFTATLAAPGRPGVHHLVVRSGNDEAIVPFVVDSAARVAAPPEPGLLELLMTSRGGSVVPEAELSSLPARLAAAFQPASRVETWHPMRSPWWIIPFALALGVEWWHRRRRGLA